MSLQDIKVALVALFLGFFPCCLSAQEKDLNYYNNGHEKELLPDANASFKRGDYERALKLCEWYDYIVGDHNAESLREKAERCAQLTREMKDYHSNGNVKEAKQIATVILSINPDDTAAKEVLSIEDPAPPKQDTGVVDPPVKVDTLDGSPPTTSQQAVPGPTKQEPGQLDEPHTRFVVKAGATVIDLKQFSQTIAPGVTVGAYDLGGSPVGGEIGAYICPGLSAVSASLAGVDASLVFRAANNIYPKLCLGFFSCKSTEGDVSTTGMCAGAGLTCMVGGHFCLEIGAKYYPKVSIQGTEMVSTTPGASYEFPSAKQILSGGIAPFVSFGWAF